MIQINENICKKLPGVTSLFVKFEYRQEIIDILKSCEVYAYDKKNQIWEVPTTALSKIIDSSIFLDDIQLNLYPEDKNALQVKFRGLGYKLQPFKHQLEAIDYGLNHDKWLLLDTMGLGKTADIIHIAEELKAKGEIEHCLIICCVNSLKSNWKAEVSKHSNLDAIIIGEKINSKGNISYTTISERAEQLRELINEFFVIVNIETLRDDKVINAIINGKNKFDMIAVDELHKCKDKQSQQGSNLLKLKARYQVGMSGTLLLNSPLDCYVPLTWIDKNKSGLTNFKQYYCTFGGIGGYQIVGFKHMDILKNQLENCSLRRTKDILDLPEKTIINEYVDLSDAHRKFYNDIKKGVKEEADKIELKTNNLLALVTRLRQATACPTVLTSQKIESSKLDRAVELVNEIISNGEKVVIMSNFKESVDVLAFKLKEYQPIIITGDTKGDIQLLVDKFQNDPGRKLFIATWQKMGTGFTLNSASYMIHIDTAWTYGLFDQTNDRIHRIGTKKPVFIYNLVCKNTIDERVLQILNTKQAFGDYVIDDKLSDQNIEILRNYIEEI